MNKELKSALQKNKDDFIESLYLKAASFIMRRQPEITNAESIKMFLGVNYKTLGKLFHQYEDYFTFSSPIENENERTPSDLYVELNETQYRIALKKFEKL